MLPLLLLLKLLRACFSTSYSQVRYVLITPVIMLFLLLIVNILLRFSFSVLCFYCYYYCKSYYFWYYCYFNLFFVCCLLSNYLLPCRRVWPFVLELATDRVMLACTSREKTFTHSCNNTLAAGHAGQLISMDNYLKTQLITLQRIISIYLSSYDVFGASKKWCHSAFAHATHVRCNLLASLVICSML